MNPPLTIVRVGPCPVHRTRMQTKIYRNIDPLPSLAGARSGPNPANKSAYPRPKSHRIPPLRSLLVRSGSPPVPPFTGGRRPQVESDSGTPSSLRQRLRSSVPAKKSSARRKRASIFLLFLSLPSAAPRDDRLGINHAKSQAFRHPLQPFNPAP